MLKSPLCASWPLIFDLEGLLLCFLSVCFHVLCSLLLFICLYRSCIQSIFNKTFKKIIKLTSVIFWSPSWKKDNFRPTCCVIYDNNRHFNHHLEAWVWTFQVQEREPGPTGGSCNELISSVYQPQRGMLDFHPWKPVTVRMESDNDDDVYCCSEDRQWNLPRETGWNLAFISISRKTPLGHNMLGISSVACCPDELFLHSPTAFSETPKVICIICILKYSEKNILLIMSRIFNFSPSCI